MMCKGEILINEIDIKEYSVRSLRKEICVMFQDYNIYPISIYPAFRRYIMKQ